jgi:hypothetical protein
MEEKNSNGITGFFDVFLSKLKEQSFIIILMIGVIYYQHNLMEERVGFWQKQFQEQKQYIEDNQKEDRTDMLERIKYLQDQRDKYVEESLQELKDKR